MRRMFSTRAEASGIQPDADDARVQHRRRHVTEFLPAALATSIVLIDEPTRRTARKLLSDTSRSVASRVVTNGDQARLLLPVRGTRKRA